jgi:hypothetical protein
MAKLKSQGTNLFYKHPVTGEIREVECITTLDGITASRDQIETTCLSDNARTYEAGLATPGAASFGIQFDPTSPSHLELHEFYVEGVKLDWAVGLSDGTAVPTGDSGGDFIFPASRSWIAFNGYISDFPWSVALNTVVTNTIAVQISDFPTFVPKV